MPSTCSAPDVRGRACSRTRAPPCVATPCTYIHDMPYVRTHARHAHVTVAPATSDTLCVGVIMECRLDKCTGPHRGQVRACRQAPDAHGRDGNMVLLVPPMGYLLVGERPAAVMLAMPLRRKGRLREAAFCIQALRDVRWLPCVLQGSSAAAAAAAAGCHRRCPQPPAHVCPDQSMHAQALHARAHLHSAPVVFFVM